jgi:hypothetical protein
MKAIKRTIKILQPPVTALTIAALTLAGLPPVAASSHSDAPLIKQDPQANLTDVYAFIGTKYNDPSKRMLNVLVSVRPFSEPGDGVIYERFADDALYSIHITNPTTGAEALRYDFSFSDVNPTSAPGLKNQDTILSYGRGTTIGAIGSVGDSSQNFTQTYSVKKGNATLGSGLKTPPPNVGVRTTPAYNDSVTGLAISGALTFNDLDSYTKETVHQLASGEVVFAGPREDGFYADTPGIFDLLDPRILGNSLGQNGGGVDGFKGFNVLSYAIQIPVESLPTSQFDTLAGPSQGVGVYASVSRQRITLRKTDGEPVGSGPWIQVNRQGNPLFNEVLVSLRDKDRYNRTSPSGDASFATYAQNPEVAVLINAVFGTSFATSGRGDLQFIYIPDVIRVDTTTEPAHLPGEAGFSRLSIFGNDDILRDNGTGTPIYSGWPNGRRIGDDVIDIALTAVASGPSFSTITLVGDNVNSNDQVYHRVFPYLATPHSGALVSQRCLDVVQTQ